jgi:hypothetical protein
MNNFNVKHLIVMHSMAAPSMILTWDPSVSADADQRTNFN